MLAVAAVVIAVAVVVVVAAANFLTLTLFRKGEVKHVGRLKEIKEISQNTF